MYTFNFHMKYEKGGEKRTGTLKKNWYGWGEVFHSRVLDKLFSLKKG